MKTLKFVLKVFAIVMLSPVAVVVGIPTLIFAYISKLPTQIAIFIESVKCRNKTMSDNDQRWFWKVIDDSAQNREKLYNILSKLRKKDIARFQRCFRVLSEVLKQEPYHTVQDSDSLNDISHWAVSSGRTVYSLILDNPEMMPISVENLRAQSLHGIAERLYKQKIW